MLVLTMNMIFKVTVVYQRGKEFCSCHVQWSETAIAFMFMVIFLTAI